MDYYDEDIKDYAEVVGGDLEEYPYGQPLDWSCIIDVSSKLGPRYDKYGREIPELGSFYNSEFGSLIAYTDEEDVIDARLATFDRNLLCLPKQQREAKFIWGVDGQHRTPGWLCI